MYWFFRKAWLPNVMILFYFKSYFLLLFLKVNKKNIDKYINIHTKKKKKTYIFTSYLLCWYLHSTQAPS